MRRLLVHARPGQGLFGHAVGAICTGDRTALIDLPGEDQHIGIACYRVVIRALELAAEAGEPFEICTSYQIIAGHLNKDRCASSAMRPLFLRARSLVRSTGSQMVFVPGRENRAVEAVIEAWQAGHRVAVPAPSAARTAPTVAEVDAASRAALIQAGWTPPNLTPALVG